MKSALYCSAFRSILRLIFRLMVGSKMLDDAHHQKRPVVYRKSPIFYKQSPTFHTKGSCILRKELDTAHFWKAYCDLLFDWWRVAKRSMTHSIKRTMLSIKKAMDSVKKEAKNMERALYCCAFTGILRLTFGLMAGSKALDDAHHTAQVMPGVHVVRVDQWAAPDQEGVAVYVCQCIYIYVYIYVHAYVCEYMCMHVVRVDQWAAPDQEGVAIYVCQYICIYTCICVRVCICV